jgi:hypothetical protein
LICPSCEAFINEENPAFCPRCGVKFASEVFDDTQSSAQLPSQPQADSTKTTEATQSPKHPKDEIASPIEQRLKAIEQRLGIDDGKGKPDSSRMTPVPEVNLVKIREYDGNQNPLTSEIKVNGQEFGGTVILTNKNLIFIPLQGQHQIVPLRSISEVKTEAETLLLRIGESEQASFGVFDRKELETWAQEIRRARESANQRNESLKEEEVDLDFPEIYAGKPSTAWYLAPILLGVIGGLIGYFDVKDRDLRMATTLLVIGVGITILVYFLLALR